MATTDLKDLHLADLHARAAAAGVEGYRLLRRDQLIERLSEEDEAWAEEESGEAAESSEAEADADEGPAAAEPDSEADTDEMVVVEATVLDDSEDEPVEVGSLGPEGGDERDDESPTETVRGVLELTRQRYGFLRVSGLAPSDGDVYISAAQVRRCELRNGDEVSGPAREPRRGERHPALVHVDTVNGEEPLTEARPEFDDLPAIQPEGRIPLDGARDDVLVRAVDLLTPLAFGQRVLVRAAPRSGRTTLLRSIARAAASQETVRVIVLLVDERPEEATAWREVVPVAEFAIATAELAPIEQVRTAELALDRARRLAETGTDTVLVCDSLTRLAIAAGNVAEVKRLFGSGRNLAGGGSLTVVATAFADGDAADAERAVATTESALVVLDPELAAAGITPPLRADECRISNEDQIREPEELEAARKLRSLLANHDARESAELLRERIEATASNAELLASL